ncbi:MAG: HAD-IA family hydrolase [Leptolyngbyaceae cyanobacterium]
MSAILFGSIGTIAETSELQRAAFNQAFAQAGLGWHWSREEYRELLKSSGGKQRIADYGRSQNQTIDADALHQAKSAIFQQSLRAGQIEPRPGVIEVMEQARAHNLKLGLVTTTSAANVSALLDGLKQLAVGSFDIVTKASDVHQGKPAADAYQYAMSSIQEITADCIAIEDNVDGLAAAQSAGLACVAFPGDNTQHHSFEGAIQRTTRLDFEELAMLLPVLAN